MSLLREPRRLPLCSDEAEAAKPCTQHVSERKQTGNVSFKWRMYRIAKHVITMAAKRNRRLLALVYVCALALAFVCYGIPGAVASAVFSPVLAVLAYVGLRVWRVYSNITTETKDQQPVKMLPVYQDKALLAKAWALPAARLYGRIIYQPVEGFCGHATISNGVFSIPPHDKFVVMPPTAVPMGVAEMKEFCQNLCKAPATTNGTEKSGNGCLCTAVESFTDNLTYEKFMEIVRSSNDSRYRLLANFMRGPLFFCDSNVQVDFFMKYMSGHWSPIAGYLEEEDLVFVLDVNEKYGAYLVPSRRMYESVNTKDLMGGTWRGLVRLTVRS